jgi:hypothetical protein
VNFVPFIKLTPVLLFYKDWPDGDTYLEELSDGGVHDHKRSMDQMHDTVTHRNVSSHDFREHHAIDVVRVTHHRVAAHVNCNHSDNDNTMNI